MALVSCPECDKEVSDKAMSCPSCGFPISSIGQSIGYEKSPLEESGFTKTVHVCNRCDLEFDTALRHCPRCSSDVFGTETHTTYTKPKVSAENINENFGVFLISIPILSAFLCIYWVGQMNLLENPISKLGILMVLTLFGTAISASMECSKYGRDNPIAEFAGFILLWVIAYPYYLYKRKAYGLRNLSVLGSVVAAIYLASSFFVYYRIIEATQAVNTIKALEYFQ